MTLFGVHPARDVERSRKLPAFSCFAAALILLELAFGSKSFSQEKMIESSKAAKICSALGVVLENANSIRSGDVLILKRDFFDGIDRYSEKPSGGTLRRQILLRMLFDLDQGLFLTARQITEDRFELDDVTADSDGRFVNSAIDGELFTSDMKHPITLYKGEAREDLTEKSPTAEQLIARWQDPRLYGLATRPTKYARFFSGDLLHQVVETEKGLEIQLVSAISDLGSKDIVSTRLDWSTMLPNRNRTYTILPKGLSASNDKYFHWKEMGNLHVPVQIKANFMDEYIVRKVNSQRVEPRREAEVDSQIDLHWFSINQPLDKELFDIKTLKDEELVAKLFNPEKSEATTIIEELLKSQEKSGVPSASSSQPESKK